MPPSPPLSSLFSFSHIYPDASFLSLFILLLYSPIGILLIFLRFFLLLPILITIIITPNTFTFPLPVVRFLTPIFGIILKERGYKKEYASAPIVACNHSGPFDVFPFMKLFKFDVLIDKGFFDASMLARRFNKIVGAIPITRGKEKEAKEKDKEIVLNHLNKSNRPLLFFPEGWDTNCTTGILLYQKFLFSLGKPIIPVALKVHVPFLPLSPSKLGTSVLKETLWLFFYPFVIFNLTFLSPQNKQKGETEIEFAKRVQQMTAETIGVVATDYSYKDALELRLSIMKKNKTN